MQSDRLKQLAGQYLQRTREEMLLLRAQLPQARLADAAALLEIQRIAHRINGSGAMLGFTAISRCASKIERMMRTDAPLSDAEWQIIMTQLQAIDAGLAQPENHDHA